MSVEIISCLIELKAHSTEKKSCLVLETYLGSRKAGEAMDLRKKYTTATLLVHSLLSFHPQIRVDTTLRQRNLSLQQMEATAESHGWRQRRDQQIVGSPDPVDSSPSQFCIYESEDVTERK